MLSASLGQGHCFIFFTWNSFRRNKCLLNLNFEFKWNDAENFTLVTAIHLNVSQQLLSCIGESLMRFPVRLFWWRYELKHFISFEFSAAIMHGLACRRGSLTQMKIITFIIIKISDTLWDKTFISSSLSPIFVRTKTLMPREVEWLINVTQLLVLEVAIECSDSGSLLGISSTALTTEHLSKWLEMS